jgi:hypothetical protein
MEMREKERELKRVGLMTQKPTFLLRLQGKERTARTPGKTHTYKESSGAKCTSSIVGQYPCLV